MCFDRNASPPILAGDHAIGGSGSLTLQSGDGTGFGAFEAVPEGAAAATVLVLPDVRGLHPYYEELACRFAQHGFRSLAIDYFGRTAQPPPDRPALEARTKGGRGRDALFGAEVSVERGRHDTVRFRCGRHLPGHRSSRRGTRDPPRRESVLPGPPHEASLEPDAATRFI